MPELNVEFVGGPIDGLRLAAPRVPVLLTLVSPRTTDRQPVALTDPENWRWIAELARRRAGALIHRYDFDATRDLYRHRDAAAPNTLGYS